MGIDQNNRNTVQDCRLFAYGGNAYLERCRIGTWPNISVGALGDAWGLTGDQVSVGCGVQGAKAFVIIRQRQNISNRGGYPYTVLLDPGEHLWNAAGWNPVRLVRAILEDETIAALVLNDVESLTRPALYSFLDSAMQRGSIAASQSPPVESVELSPFLTSKLSTYPVCDQDWQMWSSPSSLESIIDSLPVCFRTGAGWLVGGDTGHALAFGCALLIHRVTTPTSDKELEESKSRDTFQWWLESHASPVAGEKVQYLSSIPMHLWPLNSEQRAELFRSRDLSLLSGIVTPRAPQARPKTDGSTALVPDARLSPVLVQKEGSDLKSARLPSSRDQAFARIRTALFSASEIDKDCILDYLERAGDSGGARLAASIGPGTGRIERLCKSIVAIARTNSIALRWLNDAASSGALEEVPVDLKWEIASLAGESWADFRELDALFHGSQKDKAKPLQRGKASHVNDLRAMIGSYHPGFAPPNLRGLVKICGALPDPVIDDLRKLQPALSGSATDRGWTEGWAAMGMQVPSASHSYPAGVIRQKLRNNEIDFRAAWLSNHQFVYDLFRMQTKAEQDRVLTVLSKLPRYLQTKNDIELRKPAYADLLSEYGNAILRFSDTLN